MKKRHEIYPYKSIKRGKGVLKAVQENGLKGEALREACRSVYGGDGNPMRIMIEHGDPFWIGALMRENDETHAMVSLCEWNMGRLDNPTLFFERKEMVGGIFRQRMTKIRSEFIAPRWTTFGVAMPNGAKVGQEKAMPFIVQIGTQREMQELADKMGEAIPEGCSRSLTIECDDEEQWVWLSVKAEKANCWDFYATKWRDLFGDLILTDEEFETIHDGKSPEITKTLRAHVRFLAGLFVFMDMFPERIVEGLPPGANIADTKQHVEKSVIKQKAKPMTFRWPIDNTTGKPVSMVAKHWRHYTHPSKCVRTGGKPWWGEVKAHERNGKLTPYTVTKPGG